jgi:hypothetical protein
MTAIAVIVPDDYLAARLAYGAADALVKAHGYAATPILRPEAPAVRAAAVRQLREALAALEDGQ